RESYPRPGGLPVVEAGKIADDLARRDFSINAMAVRLTRSGPSELLDPFGGRGDLQAKQVRVLHSASFRDDPTRIFRAIKIARRLGFTIEKATLELILQAVRDGALYTVSVNRVTRELLFIMGEAQGDAILADLHHLGVLQAVHPILEWPYEPGQVRPHASTTLSTKDRQGTYLTAIGADLADPEAAETLARGLNLPAPHVRLLKGGAELGLAWKELAGAELDNWQVYNLLRGIDVKTIEAFARLDLLKQEAVPWQRLTLYLNSLRHLKPALTGEYLMDLGVQPGPVFGELLGKLLEQKVAGNLPEREDEERFVREWLGSSGARDQGDRRGDKSE
ncbi:MAG TPA: hypothetical protein VM409_01125, partial [Chloroflexia bacterium]|nr:hypothetical protein [Chloroflexia bacterium]